MLNEIEKKAVEELIEKLKLIYGDNLVKVILYGSKARGDSTEDSDIDIMVILKDGLDIQKEKRNIRYISWEIDYNHNILTSVIVKNEKDYLKCDTPLLLNINKEGKFLWMKK